MGYYSQMEINIKIKSELIEKFKKKIEEIKNRKEKEKKEWEYRFIDDLEVVDGYFDYPDYYCKWYEDENFVKFIKDFVEEGRIRFTGEDGEKWGYYFDGKGKVFNLVYKEEIGSELK